MNNLIQRLFPSFAILTLALSVASQALPAFPGAQGFGSHTSGGRGGRMIEVINLNDAGPGSFRFACSETGPRIIVFRTGGVLELKSEIQLVSPHITIAGQTAPGDGIAIADHFLTLLTHDVIIRGMRFRVGDDTAGERPEIRDCLAILESSAHDIIVDHCSMSWAIDETASAGNNAHHITYQWCIFSEALLNNLHSKTGHSMGLILAYGATRTSVHHCLFAHNNGRNPLIVGGSHEFVNNVIYNWGYGSEFQERYDGPDTFPLFANVAGNYFKPLTDRPTGGERPLRINFAYAATKSRLYCSDNLYLGAPFFTEADKAGLGALRIILPDSSALDTATGLAKQNTADAYDTVLSTAGALLPMRDNVDRRIVRSVRDSTGKIIDCVGPDTIFYPLGKAQGGGDTFITLDAATSSNEPRGYLGRKIEITSGTGAGQIRTITSYVPGYVDTLTGLPVYIRKAGVTPAWTIIPDSTSRYRMIIPCGNNAGGWPVYRTGTPPADSDHDGMPDGWEAARGLNPANSADGNLTTLSPAGYTNIEVYLNGLFDNPSDNFEQSPNPLAPMQLTVIPNPFHSGIAIGFRTLQGERPLLKIMDAEGRLLKILESGGTESGRLIWTWDGKDRSGRRAANGIYLISLETPELRLQKRIVLAR